MLQDFILPLVIAALTGGVVVKLLDHLFHAPDKFQRRRHNERDRLIDEVDRLHAEVQELRVEVGELRGELVKKVALLSGLTARWYALRTVVMSLIVYLRHQNVLQDDVELDSLVREAMALVDEGPAGEGGVV